MRYFLTIILTLFCVCATPALAAELPDEAQQAEAYLRGLTTAKARFMQTSPDGAQLFGTFYLSRPGRLRFEYDPPIKDFVVADGFFIYFYDAELDEQSNAPIGQTLADFLLREDLRLSGDITVKSVSRGGRTLQIELVQTEDPESGSLVLGFNEEPFFLKKWRVLDPQGHITEIELFDMERDVSFERNLFAYHKPGDKSSYDFNQ